MARSDINRPTQDLQIDPGAVLYSFVQGEQTSQEVVLDFLLDARQYIFEAVVMEAKNVAGSEDIPSEVEPGGVQDTLTTRTRTFKGDWLPNVNYYHDDLVFFTGRYYRLATNRPDPYQSTFDPTQDARWINSGLNIVIVQFPETLSLDYAVQPSIEIPVAGYFELSVKEYFGDFPQIWKPVRGMIAFHYSPTHLVT